MGASRGSDPGMRSCYLRFPALVFSAMSPADALLLKCTVPALDEAVFLLHSSSDAAEYSDTELRNC